jgi:hypothetical protein
MDFYSYLQHGMDFPHLFASAGVGPSSNDLIYVQVPSIYADYGKPRQPPVVMLNELSNVNLLQGGGGGATTSAAEEMPDKTETNVETLHPTASDEIFSNIDKALDSAISKKHAAPLKVGRFGVNKKEDDVEYEKAMKSQGYGAARKRSMLTGSGESAKKKKTVNHGFKFN